MIIRNEADAHTWALRVIRAECFECGFKLVKMPDRDARWCPLCEREAPEKVRMHWLHRIDVGEQFGYSLGEMP